MNEREQQTFGIIHKNAVEDIIIKLSEFKGKNYIDVRIWTKPTIPTDDPQPTKKGVSFHPDLLDEVIEALGKAQVFVVSENLLSEEME